MLLFKEWLNEACNCWKGYKRKPGTAPCAEGSCVKEGLANDFLKMAHEKGYKNARIVTSDQKKKETADLIKKRAQERKKNPPPAPHHVPAKTGFRSGAIDDTYGT